MVEFQQIGLTIVSLLFLWAGLAKLASPDDFRATLFAIPYLPIAAVPKIQWTLPIIEIALAVGLIMHSPIAKISAVLLLLSFCFLALVVIKAKLKIPCNCFGTGNRSFSWWTITQNLGLVILILIAFNLKRSQNISIQILTSAILLMIALSIAQLVNNYLTAKELRRLKIL